MVVFCLLVVRFGCDLFGLVVTGLFACWFAFGGFLDSVFGYLVVLNCCVWVYCYVCGYLFCVVFGL